MSWIVGTPEAVVRTWIKDGVEVTDGSAEVRYFVYDGTEFLYLQADKSTLGATPVDHEMTHVTGEGWKDTLTVPASLAGRNVHVEPTHSDPDLPPVPEEHYVTTADLDSHESNRAAMESVLEAEHDTTQSKVDQIGAAAESMLTAPARMVVPDSGSKTYRLDFVLKDLDASPVALIDPDNDRVTVTVEDQAGSAPVGLTLSDSDNLKALIGEFSTTDNLKAVVSAYTAASSLKDALDELLTIVGTGDIEFGGTTNPG